MSQNRLGNENSPYLKQHESNPVHWHPWDDQALETAKSQQKPILLSIGYSACHWCHVMAHESFEDQKTADLMNEHFVNIKIDREERPDLDIIYQAALSFMGIQGGWPLTMFLTPEAEPFWGGTYFPPEPRYGRPGFREILKTVSDLYNKDKAGIFSNVTYLKKNLESLNQPQSGDSWTLKTIDQMAERLLENVDPVNGGLGGAPKFPQVPVFELLWRAYKRTKKENFKKAVLETLHAMCQGGIYDHLGGGFARYSVDAEWLVPHFEKMLYDNALLVELMTLVWQETGDPLLETRIGETLSWLLSEMTTKDGLMAASLDADSEGKEGTYYIWPEDEIDTLLIEDADLFKKTYGITPGGNWEGVNILNRQDPFEPGPKEARLCRARAILKKERDKRPPPHRDDKELTDWTGLAICAFAKAGMAFDQPRWIQDAAGFFDGILNKMSRGNHLVHCAYETGKTLPAILDDYSNMCRAAITLYEATGKSAYLDHAENWVKILNDEFYDKEHGGYFYSGLHTTDVLVRSRSALDNATPSGNGQMCEVLTKLHLLTGKRAYHQSAIDLSTAFSAYLEKLYPSMATLINATEILMTPLQIVVTGAKGAENKSAMWQVLKKMSLPNAIILQMNDPSVIHENHPAKGLIDTSRNNGSHETVYICTGQTCLPPINSTRELVACLEKMENENVKS